MYSNLPQGAVTHYCDGAETGSVIKSLETRRKWRGKLRSEWSTVLRARAQFLPTVGLPVSSVMCMVTYNLNELHLAPSNCRTGLKDSLTNLSSSVLNLKMCTSNDASTNVNFKYGGF